MSRRTNARQLIEQKSAGSLAALQAAQPSFLGGIFESMPDYLGRQQLADQAQADQALANEMQAREALAAQNAEMQLPLAKLLTEQQAPGLIQPGGAHSNIGLGQDITAAMMAGLDAQQAVDIASGQYQRDRLMEQQVRQARLDQINAGVETAQNNLAVSRRNLELVNSGALPATDRIRVINNMGDDWISNTSEHFEVIRAYEGLLNAAAQHEQSGGVDPLVLFGAVKQYARILDPGSMVGLEEGKAVTKSEGEAAELANWYNTIVGQKITTDTVPSLQASAGVFVQPYAAQLRDMYAQYVSTAGQNGIDPSNVFRGTITPETLQSINTYAGVDLGAM